jgi:hypothetical protein
LTYYTKNKRPRRGGAGEATAGDGREQTAAAPQRRPRSDRGSTAAPTAKRPRQHRSAHGETTAADRAAAPRRAQTSTK